MINPDLSNYTRVSSILSMMPTLDSDLKWGFPMQQLDQDMLKRKADLGTAVHEAIAAHIWGKFHPVTDKEEGYVNSFLEWEKAHGPFPIIPHPPITENRLFYEPMKLTGCIDLMVRRQDNPIYTIYDYKCTVAEDKKKWPMQATFYHFLARVNGFKVRDQVHFLQLDRDGKAPNVYEYVIDDKLKSAMISLYNVYMYLTQK